MNRHTFWYRLAEHTVFCQSYETNSLINPTVLILPPIGPEYMHCHTSLRQLSLSLQLDNIPSVYVDLPGYGNSSGLNSGQINLGDWQEIIRSLCQMIILRTKKSPIVLTLRSSSLLLTDGVFNDLSSGVIWWHPYTQGKAFIRDLEMIDTLLSSKSNNQNIMTGGGFPMTNSNAESIKSLSLSYSSRSESPPDVLLIHSPVQKRISVADKLEKQKANITRISSDSLSKMARQAELSIVPDSDIQAIVQWCEVLSRKFQNEVFRLSATKDEWEENRLAQYSFNNISEEIITPNARSSCFAIITKPNEEIAKTCVIIPNTGSGHHNGPNRLHVELARYLASNGIAAVRMDLRNLGDSGSDPSLLTNDAYTDNPSIDIESVFESLTEYGFKQLVLCGVCSGAYSCFQFLKHIKVAYPVHGIFINTQTLYWDNSQDSKAPRFANTAIEQQEHNASVKSLDAWIELIVTPSKWLRIAKSAATRLIALIRSYALIFSQSKNQFENDLTEITKHSKLEFIFSPNEPGEHALRKFGSSTLTKLITEKRITWELLEKGDHTFTTLKSRDHLIEKIAQIVTAL